MRRNVELYVSAVGVAAMAATAGVTFVTPPAEPTGVGAAVCFAFLGVLAQSLGHKLGGAATGNISFIPFLTAALLAPNVYTVLAVGIAVVVAEVSAKRQMIKAQFNIAQYTLAISVSILVFRVLGGVSFLSQPELAYDPFDQPRAAIVPALGLVFAFLGLNTAAVSGAIALSESRSFIEVWQRNSLRALAYDALSLPFVFLFVYVYAQWGATGTILLTAPLLGVRQLYKTNLQLEKINGELLELMVAAIEARDPYTSGHSRRVSRNARVIARILGLSSKQVDRIATAALLHDVGKIHEIFAPILRKDGKLDPDERAIMETHSEKSAELISNVSHLHDIVRPVLHHHENWDGTGYPQRLKGDEIPLESRIIMVADTIDAMTSDRPYRKALGEAEVRRELVKFRGKQFDPAICDALLHSPRFGEIFATGSRPNTPLVQRPHLLKKWRTFAASL